MAMQALNLQFQQGFPLSRDAVYAAFQGCVELKNLQDCRHAHSLIIVTGLIETMGDHLIRLFASHGSLLEANLVFCNVVKPTDFTWNAIISAHSVLPEYTRTLELYEEMQHEGKKPNNFVVPGILKVCGALGDVVYGRLVHDRLIREKTVWDTAVGNALIDLYTKCGSLGDAQKVFDDLSVRSVVSWGAIIAAHVRVGHTLPALELFKDMARDHLLPDRAMFLCVLKECARIRDIEHGRLIHGQAVLVGMDLDVVFGSSLVDMYAKSGRMEEAHRVFWKLSNRDIVVWGALIAGYVQHEQGWMALHLCERMQQVGLSPDRATFICTLRACGIVHAVQLGKVIHSQIVLGDLHSDLEVGTGIIDMYLKCGYLGEAQDVFKKLPFRDVVSWGAIIAGTLQEGDAFTALHLFEEMQEGGITANEVVCLLVLNACGSVEAIKQGRLVHDLILRNYYVWDSHIVSAVIDMYCKCGCLHDACKMFHIFSVHDTVVWNALFTGCSQFGEALLAFKLFERMRLEGVKPDQSTFSCILKVCTLHVARKQGMLMHNQILRSGLESNIVAGNSLIDMYFKCGCVDEAVTLFKSMPCKDVVSWNSIMGGYMLHEQGHSALEYYEKMQQHRHTPDIVTLSHVLEACKDVGSITQGRFVHCQIIRSNHEGDIAISSSLIDLYATCGSLDEARRIFANCKDKDVALWDGILAAYAEYGRGRLALEYFGEMMVQGIKPDCTTYTSILAACSHVGQAEKGRGCFEVMKEAGYAAPSIEHFSCMVDLLGRTGQLHEAKRMLDTMPLTPDVTGWMCLLSACKTFAIVELGRECFERVISLNPNTAAAYVLMTSIYANAEMWEEMDKIEDLRACASAWKKPGRASITVEDQLQDFVVRDITNPCMKQNQANSQRVSRLIRKDGYVPQLEFTLDATRGNGKGSPLSGQLEKSVVGFGLVSVQEGIAIRLTNCVDQEAINCVPTLPYQTVVLRDACLVCRL